MKFKWRTIAFIISIICANSVFAQGWLDKDLTRMGNINVRELSEAQKNEVLTAAQKQGLNLSDLETMLKAKGLVAPNIQGEEFKSSKKIERMDSLPSKQVNKNILQSKVAIFGQQLFETARTPLVNNSFVSPTKDYTIGPGDNLTIRVYGLQEQTTSIVVNRDGLIFLPYGGKFKVAGLTIKESEEKIKVGLIKRGFRSLGTGESKVSITLDNYHGIQVVVWGAEKPGAYTVPAMSTMFDVLYLAGGPSINRTFREVELIRNKNTIAKLDLYDLLTEGVTNDNKILKNGDIIFLPYYQKRVRLRGEVKTPAVFELKENEGLSEALEFAGGFTEIAYQRALNVMRYGSDEKEYFNLGERQIDTFQLLGGEVIDVQSINNTEKYKIELVGAVKRPGYYAGNGMTELHTVLKQSGGLSETAITSKVLIRRKRNQQKYIYESYPLEEVIKNQLKVYLRDGDVVYFADSGDLNYNEPIYILGELKNPGGYSFGENLTLADALFLAGGFKDRAIKTRVTLSRKVKDEIQLSTWKDIAVRADYWNQKELNDIQLEPGDVITTYTDPLNKKLVYVSMEGEFIQPGSYTISNKTETLWDVYQRAGGKNNNGQLEDAVLIRERKKSINDKFTKTVVELELNELYENDTQQNNIRVQKEIKLYDTIAMVNVNKKVNIEALMKQIILKPGDRFILPETNQSIRIMGSVLNPNTLFYSSEYTFKDYVTMGGGLLPNADIQNAFIVYKNGTSKKVKSVLFFNKYPKPMPGCTINIPKGENDKNRDKLTLTERLAIYSIISTSISSIAILVSQLL